MEFHPPVPPTESPHHTKRSFHSAFDEPATSNYNSFSVDAGITHSSASNYNAHPNYEHEYIYQEPPRKRYLPEIVAKDLQMMSLREREDYLLNRAQVKSENPTANVASAGEFGHIDVTPNGTNGYGYEVSVLPTSQQPTKSLPLPSTPPSIVIPSPTYPTSPHSANGIPTAFSPLNPHPSSPALPSFSRPRSKSLPTIPKLESIKEGSQSNSTVGATSDVAMDDIRVNSKYRVYITKEELDEMLNSDECENEVLLEKNLNGDINMNGRIGPKLSNIAALPGFRKIPRIVLQPVEHNPVRDVILYQPLHSTSTSPPPSHAVPPTPIPTPTFGSLNFPDGNMDMDMD